MFITWVYQAIILLFCAFLIREIWVQRKFLDQLTAVIVLVPMILRLFMIK